MRGYLVRRLMYRLGMLKSGYRYFDQLEILEVKRDELE